MVDHEQAVQAFLKDKPEPGTVITEQWKLQHFGLLKPTIGTAAQFKQFQLNMLNAFKQFEHQLMVDHRIHLRPCKNGAHVVIHPEEQTSTAWNDGMQDVSKALHKTKVRIVNVDTQSISREKQKEVVDAQTRLGQISSMFRKAKKL